MAVDRLSVTVPSDLGAALRKLAEGRGQPVSAIVTAAIAREVRLAALDDALAVSERKFGPIADATLAEAEADFVVAARLVRKRRARRSSR